MNLIELSSADKDSYNRFVAGQTSGSFLQSWEWGGWQAALGRQVKRYELKVSAEGGSAFGGESGDTAATIQLIKMPLPFGKYYLYAPYGPVISEKYKVESRKLLQELRKKFADAVFVRVEPIDKIDGILSVARKSTNIQPAITMVVDLKIDTESILANMHPKTRYNTKIAERNGILVEHELIVTPQYGLYIKEAVDLILETQKRQNYHGHNGEYYKKLIDFFGVHNLDGDLKLQIYRALYKKTLLACGIMMDFGKTRIYLFGGSSEEQRNVMAPYLLHWQAMLDAKVLGLEFYDLGGSEVSAGGEKGFTRFKRGFGGKVVEYSGAYDIIISKPWYWVYNLLRSVNKKAKKIL